MCVRVCVCVRACVCVCGKVAADISKLATSEWEVHKTSHTPRCHCHAHTRMLRLGPCQQWAPLSKTATDVPSSKDRKRPRLVLLPPSFWVASPYKHTL